MIRKSLSDGFLLPKTADFKTKQSASKFGKAASPMAEVTEQQFFAGIPAAARQSYT
jgi:hypothetical protein